jgi:hypothetical protein
MDGFQRSAEPSIVLVQGGHGEGKRGSQDRCDAQWASATHDGKRRATRAGNARRDTHPPARSWLRAIRPKARCLHQYAEECVSARTLARPGAPDSDSSVIVYVDDGPGRTTRYLLHATTDPRVIHRRRGALLQLPGPRARDTTRRRRHQSRWPSFPSAEAS